MHDLLEAQKIYKLAQAKAKKKKIKKIKIALGSMVAHQEEINPANLKFNLELLSGAKVEIKKAKINGWKLKEIVI